MKLSDIKGDRSIEVLADLIEPVCNIAADESITLFRRAELPEGMTPKEFAFKRIKEQIPALLKNHKTDICQVFSILKGVTLEEYLEALNMAALMFDITELVSDDEFLGFFSSAQSQTSSGSVSENTEGPKK